MFISRQQIKTYIKKIIYSLNPQHIGYNKFRRIMLNARKNYYTAPQETGLISIVTLVWNTNPNYLQALTDSIINQEGGTNFEWLILDNGSTNEETVEYLHHLHQFSFIKLHTVSQNLGIIKGMRFLLKNATGQYIIPMDSDDILYPDAIKIITTYINNQQYPALLYSDEDKIEPDGRYGWPYFKPSWDPVLFVNSCYIAHLCIINRKKALELEAYTDSNADGSHDWDTFVRFHNAGCIPKHIPEVLYSWRMHSQSTAMNSASKDYLESSQLTVLNRLIKNQEFNERYFIDKNTLFPENLNWMIRRRSTTTKKIITVVLIDSANHYSLLSYQINSYPNYQIIPFNIKENSLSKLLCLANTESSHDTLIHCIWQKLDLPQQDWINEVLLHFELFPDTVVIGSRTFNRKGKMIAAGNFFGFGQGCESPDLHKSFYERGYFGSSWIPHSVDSVSSQHIVFESNFLKMLLEHYKNNTNMTIYYLGEWAGAFARRMNKRVIYTPFLSTVTSHNWYKQVSIKEKKYFNQENHDLFLDGRYFSKYLNATGKISHKPWTEKMQNKHLSALY